MAKPFKSLRDAMPETSRKRAQEKAHKMLHDIRLAELREAANLTQTEIAERMGISQAAVSRIEKGGRNLYLSTLARFVASTGGELVLSAHYPDDDEVTIRLNVD
jgi:DNA-binding XRE family transcriptional regulator